jgi:tRNA pseudouridine55 synthase
VRLYEKARKGEKVEVKKRMVEIFEFEITDINMPEVDFRVRCSKGTYIRSLANDFGKKLESGAHLTQLRRTRSGDFKVEEAETIDGFLNRLESKSE